ncbi:MAG: glycosyltransferase family 4 protein [Methanobacteriaceae archaeon]
MNICFVLVSRGWGGGENVVHQIISCMTKKNINVSLILNNEMKKYFNDLDVKILDLGSLYDSKSLLKMIINPNNTLIAEEPKPLKLFNMIMMYIFFYRVKNKVKKFLLDNKIDVIHSHLEYSDLLTYVIQKENNTINLRWICTMHGPWFSLFYNESKISSLTNIIFGRFLKNAFKKSNKITFVSKYLYDEAEKIFGKLICNKGVVIHNGISISSFKNVGSIKLKEGFNIFFPGGPKLKKGGDILIKAVHKLSKKINDLNLYVALDVPEEHLIRKLVHEYGLEDKVEFLGFLKAPTYKAMLNSVDILAMPSRMEPFGMVYLEAMALGVPIVASNVGGAPEIIENLKNGILTSPEPEKVADAILELYNDASLREEISKNNLEDIHKFEWDKIVEEYIKIYGSND